MEPMKIKKPRRLTEKRVALILNEYNLPGRVDRIMESLAPYAMRPPASAPLAPPPGGLEGAPGSEGWILPSKRPHVAYRDWVVMTTAGPLGLGAYDDWIACVFEDADRAERMIGATAPSGKWNHHAFVGYCHKPTSYVDMIAKLDRMLATFRRELGLILPGVQL